jgi:hypothetical protein
MEASRYRIEVGDVVADSARVLDLWRQNPLQRTRVEAKYRWLYLDNPFHGGMQLFLRHEACEPPVGSAGLVPRQFMARGRSVSAGQLTDLFVQESHRTLQPALLLQRRMRSIGLDAHDLLYGFPNTKSLPVVKRIGYTQLGEFTKFVMPLRYGPELRRWLPKWMTGMVGSALDILHPIYFRPRFPMRSGWRGQWADQADDRLDAFWEHARQFDGIIGVRDRRFLAWRFFERPDHRYRLFLLTRGPSDALSAYAVCEALNDTMHIRDLLADPRSAQSLRWVIHLLARQARREGFDKLTFECSSGDRLRGVLCSTGLFVRGSAPVLVSMRADTAASLGGLEWYLTAADTEL